MGLRNGWGGGIALLVLLAVQASGATALADPPSAPLIKEPEGGEAVHPADVHMEAGGFTDTDGDTHSCTDWEIARPAAALPVWQAHCAGPGPEKVHIHLGDGDFVNEYAGRTELEFSTGYELRVRFHDSAAEIGPWTTSGFTTYPAALPGGSVAWTPVQPDFRVDVVAGGFQLPVAIAAVPDPGPSADSPALYVAELYGTVKVVTRAGAVSTYADELLNFDPTGDFPGSGEQGIGGIVVEPETGDVLISMLYDGAPPDGPHYPKVVRLHSLDGGMTAASETTLLDLAGTQMYQSHQISSLNFAPDGNLYVNVADGHQPLDAQNLDSFRGKILRVDGNGAAVPANPFYDASNGITARDYVYAYGFRNPFGGAWRSANGALYSVENGPSVDRLARIDPGMNYGWDDTDESMAIGALYNWEPAHAPLNISFVEPGRFGGSAYPASKQGHAFVTETGPTYATGPQVLGKRIVEFDPDPLTGELGGHPHGLVEYTGTGKATAAGLAAGAEGLYFTELYKDLDYASPIDPGARLLLVRYAPQANGLGLAPITLGSTPSPSARAKRRCRKLRGAKKRKCRKRHRRAAAT